MADNCARLIRKHYMSLIEDKPAVKNDAVINEAMGMVIRTLYKPADELAQKGLDPVESWDDVRTMVDEAIQTQIVGDYEDLQRTVNKLFHEVIDRAEAESDAFVRPEQLG